MTIHSDVWGPARIPSLSDARYFITFIDECIRMTWVILLSNECYVFQDLYKMVATQYHCQIVGLIFDTDIAWPSFCTNSETQNIHLPYMNVGIPRSSKYIHQ